jgi:hypothetical protein
MNEVRGSVLDIFDLLEYDAFFLIYLAIIKKGVLGQIEYYIHRPRKMLVEDLGEITGLLSTGKGVKDASDGLEIRGNLRGILVPGALENHMLDEMGNTGVFLVLIARADIDPEPQGDRADIRNGLGDNFEAIRKNCPFIARILADQCYRL